MGEGLKRAKRAAERSRERVYAFEEIAAELEALAEDLGDDITLEDVKHHPNLGRVLRACDALSGRLRYDALEWIKSR